MQVNSHQLPKQPIALESTELKFYQPNTSKKKEELIFFVLYEITVEKY